MPFVVPNTSDVSFSDQAEPDAGDFRALGYRASGVVSGCAISALSSSGMAVAGQAGVVLIAGQIHIVEGNPSIALVGADTANRFDLVGVSASNPTTFTVIKGNPSANPRFPAFDPATFVFCSAVYVRASVPSVLIGDVVDKRIFVEPSLRRRYGHDDAVAVEVESTADNVKTTLFANGAMRWASSLLRRTGEKTMEWATSLTLRALDDSAPALTIKATANDVDERLTSFRSSNDVEKAYVDGVGQAFFANFKFGTGSPEGVVAAPRGALYVDQSASTPNSALWMHMGNDGTNTDWVSMRSYSATESALPVGSVIAWSAPPSKPAPTGFVVGNGQFLSETNPLYEDLFDLIGYTWGQGTGTFRTPNLSGRTLLGAGGAVNGTVGALIGLGDGKATLALANVPFHAHPVNDPGHSHPLYGFPYVWSQEPTQAKVAPAAGSNPAAPFMNIWPFGFDFSAKTGISIGGVGGDSGQGNATAPFSVLGPSAVVQYLIKL